MMMGKDDAHLKLGHAGEGAARRYLEARDYRFIEANWHCASGELDLVMQDGDELVFIEVKTRRGDASGRASEAITRAKTRKLLKTGEWYVARHPRYADAIWRCDIVAITLGWNGAVDSIEHFENAIVSG
jgi:putative endonuclease